MQKGDLEQNDWSQYQVESNRWSQEISVIINGETLGQVISPSRASVAHIKLDCHPDQ